MSKKIGFIGAGKMAQAIIGGIIHAGTVSSEDLVASAASNETISKVQQKFSIDTTTDNKIVAEHADILILAVKPNLHMAVIEEIKEFIKPHTIVITIAAGISLKFLEEAFARNIKAIRSMPNTPSLIGEGMTVLCANKFVTEEELREVVDILSCFGKAEVVQESLMDSIPAISASSPAYVYMFIEALADGGVKNGLTRDQSYTLAAQAVLGAAKMVLETGKHPGELKDEVCTPGGATIEAVAELEKKGFRAAVLSAMEKCTEKTKALGKD
ncbi:pyrroline-5-carboxylate reductase [Bacillus sp. S/N-304-OC-R1]|uniref:pyrroline-5-carboxylate reductase n=1 Tax=Bacillus sp. S/N-304-OC-R1 TaxID=2758034 RepID=UPI001C8D9200|nr:pyrroline-5-carboxylate reductase [Bacillus sp. S/N-304-OC-R1]MBY0123154.1 pyrroline-5-carboxylate reductase [Bacillus sp. S/N-304-OC-R1]